MDSSGATFLHREPKLRNAGVHFRGTNAMLAEP
jgi:hypothetical protein